MDFAFLSAKKLACKGAAISLDDILMLHKMVIYESQYGEVSYVNLEKLQ